MMQDFKRYKQFRAQLVQEFTCNIYFFKYVFNKLSPVYFRQQIFINPFTTNRLIGDYLSEGIF